MATIVIHLVCLMMVVICNTIINRNVNARQTSDCILPQKFLFQNTLRYKYRSPTTYNTQMANNKSKDDGTKIRTIIKSIFAVNPCGKKICIGCQRIWRIRITYECELNGCNSTGISSFQRNEGESI